MRLSSDNVVYLENMELYRTFELEPNVLLVISYGKRPRLFPLVSEGWYSNLGILCLVFWRSFPVKGELNGVVGGYPYLDV